MYKEHECSYSTPTRFKPDQALSREIERQTHSIEQYSNCICITHSDTCDF